MLNRLPPACHAVLIFGESQLNETFLALNSISLRSLQFNSTSFHFRLACADAKGISLVTALANPIHRLYSASAAPSLCGAFCEAALRLSLYRPFAFTRRRLAIKRILAYEQ